MVMAKLRLNLDKYLDGNLNKQYIWGLKQKGLSSIIGKIKKEKNYYNRSKRNFSQRLCKADEYRYSLITVCAAVKYKYDISFYDWSVLSTGYFYCLWYSPEKSTVQVLASCHFSNLSLSSLLEMLEKESQNRKKTIPARHKSVFVSQKLKWAVALIKSGIP